MVSTVPRGTRAGHSTASGEPMSAGPDIAAATASALSAPAATNQTASLRSIASKVREIRSGGGFGDSSTGTAIASRTTAAGCPGKREATWPSGPTPSISTSKEPAPCSRIVSL